MSIDSIITNHPAYESHRIVAESEGCTLVSVTYATTHPDYDGGEHLEMWDDNEQYVADVDDVGEFHELVAEMMAERDQQ
jgi:hypothetical protein